SGGGNPSSGDEPLPWPPALLLLAGAALAAGAHETPSLAYLCNSVVPKSANCLHVPLGSSAPVLADKRLASSVDSLWPSSEDRPYVDHPRSGRPNIAPS